MTYLTLFCHCFLDKVWYNRIGTLHYLPTFEPQACFLDWLSSGAAGGTHCPTPKDSKSEVGFYDTPGYAQGVAVAGAYAYVADSWMGMRVVNVSDATYPVEVGFHSTSWGARPCSWTIPMPIPQRGGWTAGPGCLGPDKPSRGGLLRHAGLGCGPGSGRRVCLRCRLKLPGWFTVPTPVGEYNPDWAIVMEDRDEHGRQTGKPLVYLVPETKDTKNLAKLRREESHKILCGEQYFQETLGVSCRVLVTPDELP